LEIVYIIVSRARYTKKRGRAFYVMFKHNKELLERIQNFTKAYYHMSVDMWEVPIKEKDELKYAFSDCTIVSSDKKIEEEFHYYQERHKNIIEDENKVYKFKTKPFSHQIQSFEYAKYNNRFLLADDMGLGKTKQSLDIAASRKHQFKHTLIVCGVNGLKWNWATEVKKHTNENYKILGVYQNTKGRYVQGGTKKKLEDLQNLDDDTFFIITNSETLTAKNKKKEYAILPELAHLTRSGQIGMVIIDEIHKMKSTKSQVGKAIHELDSYYKLALTGTPLLNEALDLYNILIWLGETTETLTAFKYKYCIQGGFGGRQVIGYKNLNELKERLDSIQLRRLRDEVLDLPPKIHHDIPVVMSSKQKKLYQKIKTQILEDYEEILKSPNPLTKIIRLRQATSYPAVLGEEYGIGAKMEAVKDSVDEIIARGHGVVIFSNWTSVTDGIRDTLKEHNPLVVTGDEPDEERQKSVEEFQNNEERNVIIGTIGAMGTGYTLTNGNYVIFVDEPWNQGNKSQAEDRTHRMGTTKPVSVLTFITKDTIDEDINELVKSKGELGDMLVNEDDPITQREIFKKILDVK